MNNQNGVQQHENIILKVYYSNLLLMKQIRFRIAKCLSLKYKNIYSGTHKRSFFLHIS
jgi:hypothetical protein